MQILNNRKKKRFISILIILSFTLTVNFFLYNNILNRNLVITSKIDVYSNLEASTSNINGKPLLIHQYANISKSYTLNTFPSNISYTLIQDWTSKNTTINFDGVSKKKDWITNGDFLDNKSGWTYAEVDSNNRLAEGNHVGWNGNPPGCVQTSVAQGNYYEGDMAYYYQNITIPEAFSSKIATFSFNYKYTGVLLYPPNGSIYMAIIVDGIEKNKTISFDDITLDQWGVAVLQYDPVTFGQALPGEISVRGGIYIDADCIKGGGGSKFYLDTIKFEPWTEPNEGGLIKVYDVDNDQTYSYSNLTYGEGYTFIDVERSAESTRDIIFTISSNFSDYLDFSINEVEIISSAVKSFNSTYLGESGSHYTLNDKINWQFDSSIFIPTDYLSWIEIEKPSDWIFTSVIDGYNVEQIENCI